MAELHFITGKGGVGKSTIAAALTARLCEEGTGPVLLIDVQGSGRALKLLGLQTLPYANSALPETRNGYGCRILPRETFKQYFGLLLALGNEHSTLAQVTAGLRGKITELLLENRIVSAFVDACPGLEPAVLLGKIHWEATEGGPPESDRRWAHVVVDAPSTGHFTMLFRSTYALMEVFSAGPVHKQSMAIRAFTRDRKQTRITVVSTPEELPLQESLEMATKLEDLGLVPQNFVINRAPPLKPEELHASEDRLAGLDETWRREAALQSEVWNDQLALIAQFRARLTELASTRPLLKPNLALVPELARASDTATLQSIQDYLDELEGAGTL